MYINLISAYVELFTQCILVSLTKHVRVLMHCCASVTLKKEENVQSFLQSHAVFVWDN